MTIPPSIAKHSRPRLRRGAGPVVVLLGIVAAGAQACGPKSTAAVGVSERPTGGSGTTKPTPDGGAFDGGPAFPADYRSKFSKVNKARFVSSGHASGRWDVDVWANDIAEKALSVKARDVPIGAVVVQEHYEKSGAGGAGPVMVMEKRAKGFSPEHGDWRFTVVNASGNRVLDGVAASCAGCHDDAPMDGLFPIVD